MNDQAHKVVRLPDREAIELQAALWIVRRSDAGLSAEEEREFDRWLAASEMHQSCYERLSALWEDAAILEDLRDIADAVEPERPAAGWWVRRRGALVAALAAVTVSAWVALIQPALDANPTTQDFVSATGEQRTIDLPDGSVVQLNTETAISFQFAEDARTVRLLRGEAFFDVAHDPKRRFTVQTPAGSVEAIGTAFATRLLDVDSLEVTVAEGRVAVRPKVRRPDSDRIPAAVLEVAPKTELTAGSTATYTPERRVVVTATTNEIDRKLAWRDGALVFAGESLRTVIDDVSRYTNMDISISDKALEALPIGGYFRIGETEALFEALELTFNVHVHRVGDRKVLLSWASAKKTEPGT